METILLAVSHKGNRKLLKEWLSDHYIVVENETITPKDLTIDLCLIDGISLNKCEAQIVNIRKSALPLFVPVLFITRNKDIGMATKNLWKTIDEIIRTPIEKIELQARVQSMLKIRKLIKDLRERDREILKRSEDRYFQLFNLSPDPLFIVGTDGSFKDCNESSIKLYGYSLEEFKKMKVIDLAANDLHDQVTARLTSAIESGTAFEWKHRDINGYEIPVEIRTKPFVIGGEHLIIVCVRDIRIRKEAEVKIKAQLEELLQWQTMTLGREERVIELKEEVNKLLEELGKQKKYST
jgi:PAS domain S-box-containing protein